MHSLITFLHPVKDLFSLFISQDFLGRDTLLTGQIFQKVFHRKPAEHRSLIAQFLLIKSERVAGLFEQTAAQGFRTAPLHFCYIILCNYNRCHEHDDDQTDDAGQLHQNTALELSYNLLHKKAF